MSLFKKALSSVGNALNSITGVSDSTKQQQKMAQEQNAYNTYMWNLANEYNTPSAQLARMKDAGIEINPTSYALGTGNLSNTAGTVTAGSGFVGSPAGNPISMAMGVANGIQGIRESKARTALDQANKDNMENRTKNTKLENDIMSHNLRYAQDHNLPVNSVPGLSQTGASFVQELGNAPLKTLKKYLWDNWWK